MFQFSILSQTLNKHSQQMSDNIPFEIQTQIIEKLPIKSLLRFRSVSKQWKSLIDSSEFINSYHIFQPQHNLLVQYMVGATTENYVSISDDDTFPLHKFSLTLPISLKEASVVSLSHGLLCLYGYYKNTCDGNDMVVLWNLSARRCIGIVIPNVIYSPRIGFGVCPDTNVPKLVKIKVLNEPKLHWDVEVFTLSTRVWKRVSNISPFQFYTLYDHQVSIEGFIYWLGDGYCPNERIRSNLIIYFDLRSEEFGKVYLPYSLVHSRKLKLSKRNECLTVLEYYEEGEITVCGVWMMQDDGVTKDFIKMFTVKVPGKSVYDGVLGFRKTGEAIIEIKGHGIFEYDPSSGSINDIGIDGDYGSFFVSSYMETLFLLDESDSIIH